MVGFEDLLGRLNGLMRRKVQNGEASERGLARLAGLSQSHLHNVLKGERALRPKTADRVLRAMHLSVHDLMKEVERGRQAL